MDFKQKITALLVEETKLNQVEIENLLAVPPDEKMGDFAFPCFKLGSNPLEAATLLKEKIKLPDYLIKIEVAGPYLNFFVNQKFLAKDTLQLIKKQQKKYGTGKEKKNIAVEYCGPNTNKPLHLGHLRNMALGSTVCKVLAFRGNKVHPVNIVNDRGIHICQSMLAYQKWGKNKLPDKKGDHFVGDYYVIFANKIKENEDLKREAQELLLKWEKGDKDVRELWLRMNRWVLEGFKRTYKRFGVQFEKEYFESAYYDQAKEIVLEGLKKNIFNQDETKAIIAPLKQYGLPDKVLLRGDETSIYITQDLYLANLRYKDFKFDRMIYVVASEQNLHFKQLFKILDLLGKPYAKNLYHLSYGLVNLPSGRMKSREGTVVDADDIIDEIAGLAETEVQQRHQHLSMEEVKKRGEFIALSAIKFFMLKTDPSRDITFNPEESLSFEGETGPYVQYTHARACSILRKANIKLSSAVDFAQLNSPEEHTVIKKLFDFPTIIAKTAESYKPHYLCQYLISLSQAFNDFYHQQTVISENVKQMKARLLLVDSVRQVLNNGLELLGIKALEEM